MKIHKSKLIEFISKEKIVTSNEVAREFKISWNTADSYLKELLIEGEVERIKKEDLTLWMKK